MFSVVVSVAVCAVSEFCWVDASLDASAAAELALAAEDKALDWLDAAAPPEVDLISLLLAALELVLVWAADWVSGCMPAA